MNRKQNANASPELAEQLREDFTAVIQAEAGGRLCENGYKMAGAAAEFNGDDLNPKEHLAQFIAARRYLSEVWDKRRANSYTLKHFAEDWDRERGGAGYITNGALIAAADSLGLQLQRERDNGPNAWIRPAPVPLPVRRQKLRDRFQLSAVVG